MTTQAKQLINEMSGKRVAIGEALPIGLALDPVWNLLHDAEDSLQSAILDYSEVSSFVNKNPAKKDAEKITKEIESLRKKIKDLTFKEFGKLMDLERKFENKFGQPVVYADKLRKDFFPR